MTVGTSQFEPSITIEEVDGAPSVEATTLRFTNDTVTAISSNEAQVVNAGAAVCIDHPQSTASASWVINHGQGKNPKSVTVQDSLGNVVYTSVAYTSVNIVTISFANPQTGSAQLQF